MSKIAQIANGETASTIRTKLNNSIDKVNVLGTWQSDVTYAENDFVWKGGVFYKALQESTNKDPATETAYWYDMINAKVLLDDIRCSAHAQIGDTPIAGISFTSETPIKLTDAKFAVNAATLKNFTFASGKFTATKKCFVVFDGDANLTTTSSTQNVKYKFTLLKNNETALVVNEIEVDAANAPKAVGGNMNMLLEADDYLEIVVETNKDCTATLDHIFVSFTGQEVV
jgi:hypothetical protein